MAAKNVVLSFRLKDPGGVLNYDGALAKGLELLFSRLPDALARRKMLHQLEQDHAKLLRLESGPDLDADQQTAAQVAALGHQVHPSMALPSLTPDGHAARLATGAPALPCAFPYCVCSPARMAAGCQSPEGKKL